VRLCGTLGAPRGPTNPGEADRRPALADEGVHAVLSVGRGAPPEVLARADGSLMRAIFALRGRLRRDLLSLVPGEAGAFLDSIVLGSRAALSEGVVEDFQRTGTIHMLVVSGQHLSLLAGFFWLLLSRVLCVPARTATVATLGAAVLYCLLTGAQPSILRATIMVAIVLAGRLVRREPDTLNSLAIAAAAILALSPGSLMSVGFQLSFLAILGLELVAKPLQARFLGLLPEVGARASRRRRAALLAARWAGGAVNASIGAWVATGPLIAWRFHLVTPGVVAANIAAALACAAVLYLGFAVLLLAPLSTTIAFPIAWAAGKAAALFMALVHALARAPGAYAYVADIPGLRVALAYGAAAAIAALLGGVLGVRLAGRARAGLGVAAALGGVLLLVPPGPRPVGAGAARLAVLDVGLGATAVLRTDGGVVLLDCGGGRLAVGERVIAPYLWREGVRRIEAIYLSHAHADHVNGLLDIADRFAIGRVYVGPWFDEADGGRRALAALAARRIPVEVLAAGRRTIPAPGIEVDVLAPCPKSEAPHPRRAQRGEPRLPRYEGQNDTSLVLGVRAGGRRVLVPGDIEEDGIALAAGSGADLAADVALIPHHGAKNDCMDDLAELVEPTVAIASAKRGFSAAASLAAFARRGADVRETASGGAVLVALGPGGIDARSFLPLRRESERSERQIAEQPPQRRGRRQDPGTRRRRRVDASDR
jgi:competence protein ComEC